MGDIGPVRRRFEAVPESDPVRPAPAEPAVPDRPKAPSVPAVPAR